MICALSVSVVQIIKQGEHTLFIRTKRLFLQKETLLASERNVACIREKRSCIRGKQSFHRHSVPFPPIPFELSPWRKIFFCVEKNSFLYGDTNFSP